MKADVLHPLLRMNLQEVAHGTSYSALEDESLDNYCRRMVIEFPQQRFELEFFSRMHRLSRQMSSVVSGQGEQDFDGDWICYIEAQSANSKGSDLSRVYMQPDSVTDFITELNFASNHFSIHHQNWQRKQRTILEQGRLFRIFRLQHRLLGYSVDRIQHYIDTQIHTQINTMSNPFKKAAELCRRLAKEVHENGVSVDDVWTIEHATVLSLKELGIPTEVCEQLSTYSSRAQLK